MCAFQLDPAFQSGSVAAVDWPLCHVRLQDDSRFPWLILIPRREGLHELEDLDPAARATLTEEVIAAGRLVREIAEAAGRPIQKLNVASLGNVTAQLHVHVIGRRHDDGLWPDPVWGKGAPVPYAAQPLQIALSRLRLTRGG
ncbi:MAG: HIT domain-containing protein [Brevundimonas sp.]|jgi:diadenosine tetraphosphate (Ap4A) HIT family hydrolase|uniref:HIT domain-containing protein n=1 Tax=Brevundimonas sp. TaxID=1871086 RepID=UPI0017A81B02|nr:HIT domain-containing protein [Brevundimonas sp.]MBA4803433.1 HIT domain-containing protein [Brevundimonas sp.]